jgi:hypothetical protein
MMTTVLTMTTAAVGLAGAVVVAQTNRRAAELTQWAVHDLARPMPPVVDPGPAGPPAPIPADAVVLFDGKSLEHWTTARGEPARWLVRDGYMEVVKGTGSIRTRQGFGDCQLHVEWASPAAAAGSGQDRGNSGVFLMDTYEVQVLDSYNSQTYADGMAAAIYGQYPPLVNASRKPGEWQTYDIEYRVEKKDGKLTGKPRVTVYHNGIRIHDNYELRRDARAGTFQFQDHGNPVQYRNIWVAPLDK